MPLNRKATQSQTDEPSDINIVWKRTWPERENDGIGTCKELPLIKARVYLSSSGRDWYWFVNGDAAISRGIEESKEDSVEAVKAEFRRLMENR